MCEQENVVPDTKEARFCATMIGRLNSQHRRSDSHKAQHKSHARRTEIDAHSEEADVERELIDRLVAENIVRHMKNINQLELHDPNLCGDCQATEGKILKKEFLRSKTNMLENRVLDQKVEEFLLKENTVTMVGEIAASLPKPSEDRQIIWQKLMKQASS